MKDEALRLALEALEYPGPSWIEARQPAITACKQALKQPEPEPVGEIQVEDMGRPFNAMRVTTHFYKEVPPVGTKIYTSPPKREWQGLTDEEMHECWGDPLTPLGMKHARMIEAKLKERNT